MDTPKFGLVKTANAGRALIATTDIAASQLIVTDVAAVVAPITHAEHLKETTFCISCCKILSKSRQLQTCEKCCLPVCSEKCSVSPAHSDDCSSLSKLLIRRNIDVQKRFVELAPCLGVIRLIQLKKNLDHPVNRLISARNESFELADWEKRIVETLTISGSDGFCRPDVYEALGIFATNGVKVRRSNVFAPCVALFPVFSMANHSCVCSAMYNAEFISTNREEKGSASAGGQFFIELRAQNNIKRGTQISIRYLDSLLTTPQRKKASTDKWNFVCQCPRCVDPTERGTFSSGVFCSHCSSGFLLPHFKSADEVSSCSWTCNVCHTGVSDDVVETEVLDPLAKSKIEVTTSVANDDDDDDDNDEDSDTVEVDVDDDNVDEEDDDGEDNFSETLSGLDTIERWLWTASQKLHPNHVWILELEFQLVVAYSRLVEDMIDQSAATSGSKVRPIRERIVQMTMHLLEVFARLDPGTTRWRGMLMQKLVPPWMEITKQDHECGSISVEVFKQRVFFGMLTAQEAVQCLKIYGK